MDANINRAKEGARVCEDIMRLLYADKVATERLRSVRHAITAIIKKSALQSLPFENYRNSTDDIGKDFSAKNKKIQLNDVFRANAQRTKEALRVLEELFFLFDINAAKRLQKLRFQLYDIEKESLKKIRYLRNR